ncbi:MAG: hypothetical protein NTY77_18900 [Elusimicrobia bacterium]|nr:hypothetical protein [Elusimicrobiota bacterium]
MKYYFSMGLTGLCLIVALLGFWRVHVARTVVETGVLSGKVDALVAAWNSKGVAETNRAVDIIISDAASGPDVFALIGEPSSWERFGDWIQRAFFRTRMASREDSQLVKSCSDDLSAVTWTHEGFATVSEKEMTEEVMRAVVKAHDAGAEINIVAQGVSAPPVLTALKKLEGTERAGVKVGANKVVLVGWNQPRLKRIPALAAYDFTQLGNIIELANIWVPKEEFVKTTKMQIFSRNGASAEYDVEKLWPQIGQDNRLAFLMRLVNGLVRQVESMQQIVNQQALAMKDWEAKKAAEEATKAAEAARRTTQEAAARDAEAKRLAEEAARKEEAAQKAAEAAVRKPGQRPSGASQGQKECAQCCADVGGSWVWGNENLPDAASGEFRAKYGCCNGADWPINWESVASCRAAAYDEYTHGFRCAP